MNALNALTKQAKQIENLLIVASPRQGGNSDTAAIYIEEALARQKKSYHTIHLRKHSILPCTGCESCQNIVIEAFDPANSDILFLSCPLSRKDESRSLFPFVHQAQTIWFISPVYMYHIPSIGKTFLDRLQPFWHAQEKQLAPQQKKKLIPVLIAAREKGKQLFTGIELSLKYAFSPLNITCLPSISLYGIDKKGELQNSQQHKEQLQVLAQERSAEHI